MGKLNLVDPQLPTKVITHRVGCVLRRLFSLSLAGLTCGLPRGRAEEWFDRGRCVESGFIGFFREVEKVQREWAAVEDELAEVMDGLRQRARANDPSAIDTLRQLLELPEDIREKIRANRAKNRGRAGKKPRRS
jgi:hypothetical protein